MLKENKMQGRSPPKHRHDGTSPLPLGMDWSPPPRKWVSINFLCNSRDYALIPRIMRIRMDERFIID